ncbi:palmitoyltransferase ZDHHC23 isoform 1-T7 [Anomaloglossus baeobatrachus]|uniref:palmitoyltransferase ZDHHC23 n=1 Tax=Anomaloglossus baeobatrachus TaxID=238106 RepID=UPI003F4FB906
MNGVRKKRATRSGGDAEDVLCCCEYINQKGERSHLAACLCDCEDLDEACDRWITCRSLQPEVLGRVMDTASDRFRVPWIRGARKVNLSVLPPLVVLPISLHVAAFHVLLGVVVLGSLPILVLWYYRLTHRRKGQTLLFLSLALFSLGYMYYHFVREVLLKGHVGWGHFCAISCGLLLTLLCLAKAKRDPGYLNKSTCSTRGATRGRTEAANGVWKSEDGGPEEKLHLPTEKNWCPICQVLRTPRSGHCRICGSCVQRLDHHCVWINNCIGSGNHRSFLLLLVVFQFTSVYGMAVTLGAVCPERSVFGALFYCPGVYDQYSASFAFTCVWYCGIVTAGLAYLLLIQILNISYNVTEREARIALREGSGRCLLGGLVVDTGTFSRGFLQNWLLFLSLDCAGSEQDLPALV